jgi:hypothetical protein
MTFDLVFFIASVFIVIGAIIYMKIILKDLMKKTEAQLKSRGFVMSRGRNGVVSIWGRYAKPVPFYLHFSNRDLIASMAGQMGIADISLGYADFDRTFFVRSNQESWAKEFMTAERCHRLMLLDRVQFLTSSIGNQLTPDYWPKVKVRDQRDMWMLHIGGNLADDALAPYIELAQELASTLEQFCQNKPRAPDDCKTSFFEGQ